MERTYSHRVRQDLLDLERDLGSLTIGEKSLACMFAYRANLMRPPLPLRASLGLICLKHGKERGTVVFAADLAARSPATVADLWQGIMRHLVDGKDTYDARSAGGWNKAELDRFLGFVGAMGWKPPALAEHAEAVPAPVR
jgi:hypothetical protein